MANLDTRLSNSLARIRDAHTDAYRADIALLREQVLRRTRRRRAESIAATAVVAVAAVLAAVLVLPSSVNEREGAPPAAGPRAFALWPEFSQDAAVRSCAQRGATEQWRTKSDGVANRFITDVIGWSRAAIEELAPVAGQERFSWTKVVPGRFGHRARVTVVVTQVPGTECWSVSGVYSPSPRTLLSFGHGVMEMDVKTSLPYDTVDFELVQEGRAAISGQLAGRLPIEINDYQAGVRGYFLVMLERRGQVVWARGEPLPREALAP